MNRRAKWYVYVPLVAWVVISLFPALWMLESSFKDNVQIYQMPPIWWVTPNLDAFKAAFRNTELAKFLLNSIEVAGLTTILTILLGVPAAWGLSKFRYPGRKIWFYLVVGTRMLPPVGLMTPFFGLFLTLNLIDHVWALIIPYMFFDMPLAIWICKNYFDGLPREITDSAIVDGANKTQMFFRMGLPLAYPGIVLSAILVFLFSWNEFMFALVLTRQNAVTLPVGIQSFYADGFVIWNQLSAAVVTALVPAVIFVAFFQRFIIKGMTEGALKG